MDLLLIDIVLQVNLASEANLQVLGQPCLQNVITFGMKTACSEVKL